jgi:hypothetical protein
MRKLLVVSAALAVAAAMAVPALGDGGGHGKHGASSTQARGAALLTAGGVTQAFAFRVSDGGTAGTDRGVFGYCNRTAGFCYRAQVSCVSIQANIARIGYVIPAQANLPAGLAGTNFVWQFQDMGRGATTPDTAGFVVAPATSCDTATVTTAPIAAGQISIGARHGDDQGGDNNNQGDDD